MKRKRQTELELPGQLGWSIVPLPDLQSECDRLACLGMVVTAMDVERGYYRVYFKPKSDLYSYEEKAAYPDSPIANPDSTVRIDVHLDRPTIKRPAVKRGDQLGLGI